MCHQHLPCTTAGDQENWQRGCGQGVSDIRDKRQECCHDSNYMLMTAASAEHLWVR